MIYGYPFEYNTINLILKSIQMNLLTIYFYAYEKTGAKSTYAEQAVVGLNIT